MPKRNSKGQFVKGGGKRKARRSRSSGGGALVVVGSRAPTRTRTRTVVVKRKARRRSGGKSGGGIKPLHLALAAAGVAFLAGPRTPVKKVPELMNKVPGAKTFGPEAVLGVACLAANKWVKPNKWLKLAGYAGIVAAAMKVGQQGTDFKYVGDVDEDYDIDADEFVEQSDEDGYEDGIPG